MAKSPFQQPQDEYDDTDAWIITYADAVTLLMAFFIMLISFSRVDIPLFEKVAAGIKSELGKHEVTDKDSPMTALKVDLEEAVFTMQADQNVRVATDHEGVVIELDSTAFFRPNSADIIDQAKPVLLNMASIILAPKYESYFIEVEGHTDDDPISTPRFPSNWELSAGRAASVLRFFVDLGSEAEKMKAVGYAATRPKAPNRTADGLPIPANQTLNRRVILRVRPMSLEESDNYFDRKSQREMEFGTFSRGRPVPPKNLLLSLPPR